MQSSVAVFVAVLLLLVTQCSCTTAPTEADAVNDAVARMFADVPEPSEPYTLAVFRAQRAYLVEWIARTLRINGRYMTVARPLHPSLADALRQHAFHLFGFNDSAQLIFFPVEPVTHTNCRCHHTAMPAGSVEGTFGTPKISEDVNETPEQEDTEKESL